MLLIVEHSQQINQGAFYFILNSRQFEGTILDICHFISVKRTSAA